ncbi:MAG: hypothetical protein J2P25_12660 [Nocardiopsaceae bacterium]|nr:hypothetical protein [Nocardiopsaceae bacterium]
MAGGVQHTIVVVLAEPEIDADTIAKTEQQLKLSVVAAFRALLDPHGRPLMSTVQVSLLSEKLSEQVAGTWSHLVAFSGDGGEQLLGLSIAVEGEQRPDQVDPRIGKGLAAVLKGLGEFLGGALGVVRHHPLLAGAQVRLSALTGLGTPGQVGHANSGTHMVASPCRLELDFIEVVGVRHPPYRTVTVLSQTCRYDRVVGISWF